MTGMADIGMAGEDRGGEVTIPGTSGGAERPAPPERAVKAGPVAEDDVTEWLGAAGTEPARQAPAESGGPWWPGTRVTACTVVVGLVIGVLAAVAFRHYVRAPGGDAAASRQAAVRDETASWVAQQVSQDVKVSCDQVMCAALRAHGFPTRHLLPLGPVSSALTRSDVVVETPAVRRLFGTSLAIAWAPAVLASFGSGSSGVTVRVVAPNGAAAYQAALSTSLAARKAAGAALLHDRRITVPASAAGQLAVGLVDSRLLRALAALARRQPIAIVGFGNTAPRASAGIPLRYADLAENDQAASLSGNAYVKSVRVGLNAASTAFHLMPVTTITPRHGPSVLRVQVTAPTPPGLPLLEAARPRLTVKDEPRAEQRSRGGRPT
jgi:hypothetical protein